jgi:hypothetical protein
MKLRYFLFSLLFLSSSVSAETEEKFELHPALGFLIVEGFIAINAAMASEAPEVYGSVLALLSPLGASSNVSETTNWVGIGSAATLGLYNAIELSDDKYSKNDIFMKNVYGWHALVLISGVTEWLTGEEVSNDNVALFPVKNGLVISMNYEF